MRKIVKSPMKKIGVQPKMTKDDIMLQDLKYRVENRILEVTGYTEYCREQDDLLYAQWEESPELLKDYN